jgi:heterodisulfide reductase subunit B
MRYGYYPGCSLERNASAYHVSAMEVARRLNLSFSEVDDWNCCGATEFIAVDRLKAYALVGRNLALASHQLEAEREHTGPATQAKPELQLVAPCSACYLNLSKVSRYLSDDPELAGQVNQALAAGGLHYEPGSLHVRHLLDIIVNDVGYTQIESHVRKPLKGLRVAPYYGCLVVRPGFQGSFDDPEYPTSLDQLTRTLGARVVDFPLKAHCCGGHMTQISQDVALELLRRLLKNASDYDADVLVTVCPMCQLNLDAFQQAVNRKFGTNYNIPVLYFTQLMGLAFGMSPTALGIGQEFVDARPALAKVGARLDPQDAGTGNAKTRKRRKEDKSLPMPHMPEEGQS